MYLLSYVFFLIFVLSMPFGVQGQGFFFVKDSINLGRIDQNNTPIDADFHFEVKGSYPIQITSVTPDCACITSSFPTFLLNSGAKNKISIRYDAYKAGSFDKKFRVIYTEGNETMEKILTLSGYITPHKPDPKIAYPYISGSLRMTNKTVNLGTITNEGVVKKKITLYNQSAESIKIDSVITPKHIEIIFDSLMVIKPFIFTPK
jgi:hypothetical protein